MPYRDLRDFMEVLRQRGELRRVKREVDRYLEVTTVTKKSLDTYGPALLFENVKGFDVPVVMGLHGTKERCYLGFETDYATFPPRALAAIRNPLPCRTVRDGPCKEVVKTGKDVDLNQYPVLWCNVKDAGYYIDASVLVVVDPDTGKRNASIHRCLLLDHETMASMVNIFHLWTIIQKWWKRGESCPVALAIGCDPAVYQSAAIKMPYEIDELEFAGAIRREPVNMVPCETIPVDVPATTELVIEGEIPVGVRVPEGPFSEFTGFFGEVRIMPTIKVKAITHRRDLIYHSIVSGFPIDDQQALCAVAHEVQLWDHVSRVVPQERIRGIWCTLPSAGFNSVISFKKVNPGEGKTVALAAMSFYAVRNTTIVDDDVDPSNPVEVEWARTWRSRHEDMLVAESLGAPLDPMGRQDCISSKVAVDATTPLGGDKFGDLEQLVELGPARFPTEQFDPLSAYVADADEAIPTLDPSWGLAGTPDTQRSQVGGARPLGAVR